MSPVRCAKSWSCYLTMLLSSSGYTVSNKRWLINSKFRGYGRKWLWFNLTFLRFPGGKQKMLARTAGLLNHPVHTTWQKMSARTACLLNHPVHATWQKILTRTVGLLNHPVLTTWLKHLVAWYNPRPQLWLHLIWVFTGLQTRRLHILVFGHNVPDTFISPFHVRAVTWLVGPFPMSTQIKILHIFLLTPIGATCTAHLILNLFIQTIMTKWQTLNKCCLFSALPWLQLEKE
jgi:hypothetical protein